MRPASKARRPASTPSFIASAIFFREIRGGDGGVHEDGVGPRFHGERGVGSGSHARVHDERNFGNHVLDAEAGVDGARREASAIGVERSESAVGAVKNGQAKPPATPRDKIGNPAG
jgi:hypothetical protein